MTKSNIAAVIFSSIVFFGGLSIFIERRYHRHAEDISEAEHQHDHGHHHHEHHEHGGDDNNLRMTPDQIQEYNITIEEVQPGVLDKIIATRGKITLHPDLLVHILPKIPGVAKEARKNIGDSVEPGEIIAVLESREIADVKAQFLAAMERQNLTSATLEGEARLYKDKVSSRQDFLNAKSAYEEANINVQLSRQKLRAFDFTEKDINALFQQRDLSLRLYEIKAPIKGTVIARHITTGEYIEDNKTIYEIADLTKVWVEIGIYPKEISKVIKGQLVDVILPAENISEKAPIIYVSPLIQEDTIIGTAIAELANSSGKWRPGSFVKVNIATGIILVDIKIPQAAIQAINGSDAVFVRTQDGFEKRLIKTGRSDGQAVEVLSGLSPGEKIAAANAFLLKAELGKAEAEHEH